MGGHSITNNKSHLTQPPRISNNLTGKMFSLLKNLRYKSIINNGYFKFPKARQNRSAKKQ